MDEQTRTLVAMDCAGMDGFASKGPADHVAAMAIGCVPLINAYSVTSEQKADVVEIDVVPTVTISETAVQEIAAPLSDDAVEIADHNARVQELVDQDSPPLTAAERAASVEWVWQPGAGLVRQG